MAGRSPRPAPQSDSSTDANTDAAVGTRAPAGFLGLSGNVPLVLIQGYPLDNGGYFFELVPSAEYVGCEYRVERGADGTPIVRTMKL